jgi:hypothetical protein
MKKLFRVKPGGEINLQTVTDVLAPYYVAEKCQDLARLWSRLPNVTSATACIVRSSASMRTDAPSGGLFMTRRKGETTGRINEREYPYLVELALPSGVFVTPTWISMRSTTSAASSRDTGGGVCRRGNGLSDIASLIRRVPTSSDKFGGQVLIAARRPER